MLALTQPLPVLSSSGGTINDADPWAIQLANEQRCALLTGMGNSAGGVTLSYGCGSDHSETSAVDTRSQPWTVEYDQGGTSSVLTTESVIVAWF